MPDDHCAAASDPACAPDPESRPIAALPPDEGADYWVLLGQWGLDHAGPEGIPFADYGAYVCDWNAQCRVCMAEVATEVAVPFHPRHLGWEVRGAVGKGRTWCHACGASVWATLVRIRHDAASEWGRTGEDSRGPD